MHYSLSYIHLRMNISATFSCEKQQMEAGYVSRSCGFKIIYMDVSFTSDNTWITSITPENLTSIENQNAAHVQIFH